MLEVNTSTILLKCPKCGKAKKVNIPTELVKESNHILTISIPHNYICEHSFHAYIDLNFKVRGYQDIDFDLKEIEVYETGSKSYDFLINYEVSLFLKSFIENLHISSEKKEILGGVIFNQEGKLIHFSIPDEMFLKMIEQFQLQKQDEKLKIKKFILIFENEQGLMAQYEDFDDVTLIIGVLFPEKKDLGDCEIILDEIIKESKPEKKIKKPIDKNRAKELIPKIMEQKKSPVKEPSNYWIFSKISDPEENLGQLFIDALNYRIDKKNILNMNEIIRKSKEGFFEGKIYFSENYITLMQGLAFSMKDAQKFMNKLNRAPNES